MTHSPLLGAPTVLCRSGRRALGGARRPDALGLLGAPIPAMWGGRPQSCHVGRPGGSSSARQGLPWLAALASSASAKIEVDSGQRLAAADLSLRALRASVASIASGARYTNYWGSFTISTRMGRAHPRPRDFPGATCRALCFEVTTKPLGGVEPHAPSKVPRGRPTSSREDQELAV